ncbi:MAG: Gfo/Idh/MocA family oxidoreductase, partial [Candidatus Sulfotelmatobacter sp.]
MRFYSSLACIAVFVLYSSAFTHGQSTPRDPQPPLRVAIVGLVHGHVQGFFEHSLHNPEIEIVGIAEPDESLSSQYARRYSLEPSLLFSDLETMLAHVHPQAVLVYTNTFDHRRV